LLIAIGDFHAAEVCQNPADKTGGHGIHLGNGKGRSAPILLVLPDAKKERNAVELIGIPKVTSYLAYRDFNAEIKGLKAFPAKDRRRSMESF